MKKNSYRNLCKDAVGAMFLLAGAFFVCSTLLSMRAVLADPIAPVDTNVTTAQNTTSSRNTNRANPRANNRATTTARPTATAGTSTRGVASRNVASRTDTTNVARNVVSRTASRTTATRGTSTRNVRSRTAATNASRVSLQGDAIRGVKNTSSTYYTYLSNKLYTGNYSNIIDSTTGLISADAYSTCLESYYTCMDEICTARNEAQRRCACAGRVKAFAAAESALESANEELIKVSGELALLIANKGKDISSAFTLTEAEQVMNCVSWKETTEKYGLSSGEAKEWCYNHGIYGDSETSITVNGKTKTGYYVSNCKQPDYCSTGTNGNNFGFNVNNMNGTSSDILASLAKWADEVQSNTNTILKDNDNDVLANSIANMASVTSGMFGIQDVIDTDVIEDTLAETWGYDLFQYAHNNVCARVLDSCFNGIYEACGTPPSGGRCANGATSSCPYNYNSKISVDATKGVTLNERSTTSANTSASCFGYTSTSSDPYSSLRGPVADARRSVMQKYLLDANADCDAYGEQLKTTAQKITYQKVAAQQALQQKRLEFYNEEQNEILANAIAAGTNFNECMSELVDCYETAHSANASWSVARVKNYCAQIANAPHCYETMICNPSYAQFRAIIDKPDDNSCTWDASDYTENTCRNVVTLNEILHGATLSATGGRATSGDGVEPPTSVTETNKDSAALREYCIQEAMGCADTDGVDCLVRGWTFTTGN